MRIAKILSAGALILATTFGSTAVISSASADDYRHYRSNRGYSQSRSSVSIGINIGSRPGYGHGYGSGYGYGRPSYNQGWDRGYGYVNVAPRPIYVSPGYGYGYGSGYGSSCNGGGYYGW